MQRFAVYALLAALGVILLPVESYYCASYSPDSPTSPIFWEFGILDSEDGQSPTYQCSLLPYTSASADVFVYTEGYYYYNFFNFVINGILVNGAKNWTYYDDSAVPTASFTCDNEYSGLWGPSYPDARFSDTTLRGQFQNLEVYVHFSAPNQTSYVRSVIFVKNIGDTPEQVTVNGGWSTNGPIYAADISPVSNEGRYVAMWPWLTGDLGRDGDNPSETFSEIQPLALHCRGPKGRENVNIAHDMAGLQVSPVYHTELDPNEEIALMFVVTFGKNTTLLLKNAAEIDTEPVEIFHGLSATQLSLIRNWGACEAVLGPDVQVTIAASTCSEGLTSEFTVNTTTARSDLNNFIHLVVLPSGEMLVASETSPLAVPNGVGTVKHQYVWNGCIVKETEFDTCDWFAASTPVTDSPANKGPLPATSGASSSSLSIAVFSVVALLNVLIKSKSSLVICCVLSLLLKGACAQSTCTSYPLGELGNPIQWRFGLNDGANGEPAYIGKLDYSIRSPYDLYTHVSDSRDSISHLHTYWINGVPLVGAKNFKKEDSTGTPTANFTCDSNFSGLWGPAYPDLREDDGKTRGQYQDLEVYIHYSAPNKTSYIRSVVFIKNVGSSTQRVNLFGDWYMYTYPARISPLNNGRYYTRFPWQETDSGQNGDNPAASYDGVVSSVHAAGPTGREATKSVIFPPYMGILVTAPTYYTTLVAGQEMALMYLSSFGLNKTLALKNAAEIDTEPAFIFHGLNADQLSLIRNWGACQAVLGPAVQVTVTTPSQCSSGVTSDFTVTTTTTRTDFVAGFTHRVVSSMIKKAQVVAPQSSATLSIVNDIGPLTHQLWYRECLVKETSFASCTTSS